MSGDNAKEAFPSLEEVSLAEIRKLVGLPDVVLQMQPFTIYVLISNLILALRHPSNTGPSSEHARHILEQLRRAICAPGSPLDTIIGMGFDPQFDVASDANTKAADTTIGWVTTEHLDQTQMTVGDGEKYGPTWNVANQENADEYFEALVKRNLWLASLDHIPRTRQEAEEMERHNIGYFAGYAEPEVQARVNRLFRTSHPYQGGSSL